MKISEKIRSILYLIILGGVLTPGVIIVSWRFQILSYMLLLKYCLILFPVIFIGVLIINRTNREFFSDLFQKRSLPTFLGCMAFSLIMVSFKGDFIRYLLTIILATFMLFFTWTFFVKIVKSLNPMALQKSYHFYFLFIGLIGVLIFLYMAYFVRLYSDDFCYTVDVMNRGLINEMILFYQTWSGRFFSNIFVFSFISAQKMPLIELIIMILVSFVSLRLINKRSNKIIELWTVSGALFLPFALFSTIPDPYKSLYWIANMESIVPISIILIYFIAFMIRGFIKGYRHELFSLVVVFILSFAISNGHEILAPAMMLLCSAFFFYSLTLKKQNNKLPLKLSTGAVAGTFLGLLILFLSPGNYLRMAAQDYPPIPGLFSAILMSSKFYFVFLTKITMNWKWTLLIASFILGMVADPNLSKNWKTFVVIVIIMIGASWGTFLISFYAMSASLPTRTQFIPMLFLVLGIFSLGLIIPRPKINNVIRISAPIILILLGFTLAQVIVKDYQLIGPMVRFSRDWDQRDYNIRVNNVEPYKIDIPWEKTEHALHCVIKYYSHVP